MACGVGVAFGTGVAGCEGFGDCAVFGLGVGDLPATSTSAAKRFTQLSKTTAHDNRILRMSAYATPCLRFRKINLAPAPEWSEDETAFVEARAARFYFLEDASAI